MPGTWGSVYISGALICGAKLPFPGDSRSVEARSCGAASMRPDPLAWRTAEKKLLELCRGRARIELSEIGGLIRTSEWKRGARRDHPVRAIHRRLTTAALMLDRGADRLGPGRG